MRYIIFVYFICLCVLFPRIGYSEDLDAGLETRRKLASEYHEIRPVNLQVELAVDTVLNRLSLDKLRKNELKNVLLKNMDYEELKILSTNSMAEVFSEAELKWMIDYYSKEEASSIEEKMPIYNDLVMPVITQMLDKAFMEIRTGASMQQ